MWLATNFNLPKARGVTDERKRIGHTQGAILLVTFIQGCHCKRSALRFRTRTVARGPRWATPAVFVASVSLVSIFHGIPRVWAVGRNTELVPEVNT